MRKNKYFLVGAILVFLMLLMPISSASYQKPVIKNQDDEIQPDAIGGGIEISVSDGSSFSVKITNTKKVLPIFGVGWGIVVTDLKGNFEYGLSGTLMINPEQTINIFEISGSSLQDGTYGYVIEVVHPKISITGTPSIETKGLIGTFSVSNSVVNLGIQIPDSVPGHIQQSVCIE